MSLGRWKVPSAGFVLGRRNRCRVRGRICWWVCAKGRSKTRKCDGEKSSPRGRVALLGIAQRQVRVSRAHIRVPRIPRKSLPTSMKTFGDLLHIKRYERHLTLSQIGRQMGIAQATVKAWEMDTERPDGRQMEQLRKILGFDAGVGDCLPSP